MAHHAKDAQGAEVEPQTNHSQIDSRSSSSSKIVQLPKPSSSLLTSTYLISSFESAIQTCVQASLSTSPHSISITVQPEALRFTVVDDGPGLSKDLFQTALQTTLLPPTSKYDKSSSIPTVPPALAALTALATTSTVELRVRTQQYSGLKTIRASKQMDMRYVPTSNASTLLKVPGMQIELWELFHTTPVRRRIEQDRSVESISRTVRETIAVLALANPRTSFTLRIQNLLILHTPRAARLAIDHVCTVVDDGRAQPWLPVSFMHRAISFVGFISGSGLPHARAQFVSIDGLPAPRSAYHDAFAKACRAWLARSAPQKSHSSAPARRHPAFAVNVMTGFRPFASLSQQHPFATPVPHFKNLDILVHQNVINALSGNVEPPESKQLCSREEPMKTPIPPSNVTKKRRRFEDADLTYFSSVTKYPRFIPPGSCAQSHVHSGSITCLKKTFYSSISSRNAPQAGPQNRGMGLRAAKVEQAFRKHVAGWCNPCFQSLGSTNRPLQKKNRMSANKSTHDSEPTGKWVAVSKTRLPNMRVVGQVDNKFIVVMSRDDATLYALDQHAVSERVLFERLLRNAENEHGVRAATLRSVKQVSVSKTQRDILMEKRVQIERWGWRIQPADDADPVICLSHVPKVTGLNGHELIIAEEKELVSYADELLDGAVTGCLPKVLIDAMASVACHSAVRFGDRLSKQQCEHLLFDGLSECQNPFACAHGRPSIVPLAVLDGAPSLTS